MSYGESECYLGFGGASPTNDWHSHATSAPDGGRAFQGSRSLHWGRHSTPGFDTYAFAQMDAVRLGFRDGAFDRVVCIQNGISAFHVDASALVRESLRVMRPGGIAIFSSYSDAFWEHRLEWFVLQAAAGLVGEIDREKTRDGTIACTDGFTATTVGAREFEALAEGLGARARIVEIDSSSVFCEITAGIPLLPKKGLAP